MMRRKKFLEKSQKGKEKMREKIKNAVLRSLMIFEKNLQKGCIKPFDF